MFKSASIRRTVAIRTLTAVWRSGCIDATKMPLFHKLCAETIFKYSSAAPQQKGKRS
jgi:hypothetical protein